MATRNSGVWRCAASFTFSTATISPSRKTHPSSRKSRSTRNCPARCLKICWRPTTRKPALPPASRPRGLRPLRSDAGGDQDCGGQRMKPGSKSEIIVYQTEDNRTRIEVRLEGETVWLTQKQMAELFQKDVRTINEHIQNVFGEGELQRGATSRKFRIVQLEGARSVEREVDFYNLDVVISVGYQIGRA